MTLKNIPNTNLNVSAISLGTAEIATLDNAYQLLDAYLDRGGNFIDTALVYANWLPGEHSSSEKTIGRWLSTHKIPRDRVIIATKGAHPKLTSMDVSRVTPEDIAQDINDSLLHLRIDTIDLYWLHRDNPTQPIAPIINALEGQVQAGKIRYYACSNWSLARIQAANDYASRAGYRGFVANQPMWSMAQINLSSISDPTLVLMDDELYAYHKATGMAVIPFSSQAKGYYSKLADMGYAAMNPKLLAQYDNASTRQRFDIAQQIAQRTGYTLNQIALAYLMQQPVTTIPIVGCKTLDHLEASMSALDVTLSEADFELLTALPSSRQ